MGVRARERERERTLWDKVRRNEMTSKEQEEEQEEEEEKRKPEEDITIGFLEEAERKEDLESPSMPSKAGGKPAWMSLDRLPEPETLSCPSCHVQMAFLLQLYAPIPRAENESARDHRAVFVFCCRSCNTFRCFRSQLADVGNEFFESEGERKAERAIRSGAPVAPVCDVCGCSGPKVCSRCHVGRYCSEHHQRIAWSGGHKSECSRFAASPQPLPPTAAMICRRREETEKIDDQGFKFIEMEIVTEEEPTEDSTTAGEEEEEARIKKLQQEFEERRKRHRRGEKEDEEEDEEEERELRAMSAETEKEVKETIDGEFLRFQKRLRRAPNQVVRYLHNVGLVDEREIAEPLWCSTNQRPTPEQIPPCPNCGSKRVAEFQIMPQILFLLSVSPDCALDFGTLVVFSCSKSCEPPSQRDRSSYVEEFVWCQLPTNQKLP